MEGEIAIPKDLKKFPQCTDCLQCQMCAEVRCQQCRATGSGTPVQRLELGPFITHGQYLEWKSQKYGSSSDHTEEHLSNEKNS